MQGKRIYLEGDDGVRLKAGEYGKHPGIGIWYACTPNGLMGNLSNHEVIEHEDGSITVSPSILVESYGDDTWHGYLEHGVWREV